LGPGKRFGKDSPHLDVAKVKEELFEKGDTGGLRRMNLAARDGW